MSENWAGIITIGNEILSGDTVDGNSAWLGKELMGLGIKVRKKTTVRDDVQDIGEAVRSFSEDFSPVIVSGGLGPTHDDVTLEGISRGLDRDLVKNEKAYEWIKSDYRSLYEDGVISSVDMSDERVKMSYLPEGSEPLRNGVGTAPGVRIDDTFVLPGLPDEMKVMFRSEVVPRVKEMGLVDELFVKSFAVDVDDESKFAPYLKELKSDSDVEIHSSPHGIGEGIKIVLTGSEKEVKRLEKKLRLKDIYIKEISR